MTAKNEIFKCEVCKNLIEVINNGDGPLHCCDQPMKALRENTVDAAKEKHIPVVEKVNGGVQVTVGSVEHPMTEEHYIMWIEVITDTKTYRKDLKPGDKPQAFFEIDEDVRTVREYCNLHGLWKA